MGKTVVGANEASAGRETLPSKGTPSVVIEWAGTYDSIVYMIEIRNAGSEAVDLSNFQLAAGSCSDTDEGFRVVKGSPTIAPGERALILTHSSVPTDDEPRQQYTNLLVATGQADSLTLQRASTLTLVDASGASPDVPLGPIMSNPAIGECCRPLTGGGSQDCMNPYGGFPCTGTTGGCWVLVTKAFCCGIPACGWIESNLSNACVRGCPGSRNWTCCP